MTNYLKVNDKERKLVMDRTFAKNAAYVGSEEYDLLQSARAAYPKYRVVTRSIKRNAKKKTYAGLTYEYMRSYIATHEKKENVIKALHEFEEMLLISRCHGSGYKYPVIKSWFLERYSEIAEYGMPETIENVELKEVA